MGGVVFRNKKGGSIILQDNSVSTTDRVLDLNSLLDCPEPVILGNIATPVIMFPSNNSVEINTEPIIQISVYLSTTGSLQTGMDLEIFKSDDIENPIFTASLSGSISAYLIPANILDDSTTYLCRVRYKDADGMSNWSLYNTFTTVIPGGITKPINISPAIGEEDIDDYAVLESSEFASSNPDEHIASQWQVFADPLDLTSTPIHDSGWIGNLNYLSLHRGVLYPNTTYHWRVRHYGKQYGWSLWSDATVFYTAESFNILPLVLMGICTGDTVYSDTEKQLRGVSIDLSGNPVTTSLLPPTQPSITNHVHCINISLDNKLVAVTTDNNVTIYERNGSSLTDTGFQQNYAGRRVRSCEISPDNNFFSVTYYLYECKVDIYKRGVD
jgi:hypothetical protein